MNEMPYAPGRIEKAVSMLIMAKRILDAWPVETSAPGRDRIAAETAAGLVQAAITQLSQDS
jgi:hypothetical protein